MMLDVCFPSRGEKVIRQSQQCKMELQDDFLILKGKNCDSRVMKGGGGGGGVSWRTLGISQAGDNCCGSLLGGMHNCSTRPLALGCQPQPSY